MSWSLYSRCVSKVGFGLRNLFGIKRTVIQENGQIDLEMLGSDCFNLTKTNSLICIKMQ